MYATILHEEASAPDSGKISYLWYAGICINRLDVNERKEKHEQNMIIMLELSVSKREEENGMP